MVALSVLVASVVAGCSGDGDAAAGTVDIGPDPVAITTQVSPSLPVQRAATPAPATSAIDVPEDPASGPDEVSVPRYEVFARTLGDAGDTLILLLDTASYTSLSDIDLQNIIADVYERFPPVLEAHVIDDERAATLAVAQGPAAVTDSELAEHYLVRLEDGFHIVFLGRFDEFGTTSLGS